MSPARPHRGEGLRLAFWAHQLVEYLLGALIVLQSINGGRAAPYIAAAGGLLFLLAALTDGPCAVVRWIPARLHRMLEVLVIVALVLAPIVSRATELLAWSLCLLAAAALIWLRRHTEWVRPVRRARPPAPKLRSPEPTSPDPTLPDRGSLAESARALGATVDRTTRGASRAAGRIYGRSRARRTGGGEKPERDA